MPDLLTITMTPAEIAQFREQGYAGPYAAMPAADMATLRERIDREVMGREGLPGCGDHQSRHLDSRLVYDLCANPQIVERMAAIYGPDLVLWRSNFFKKLPGDQEVPWHQDLNYWPLEPLVNITAWLAIDPATSENACVQFIPGSHKKALPHVQAPPEMAFGEMADPACADTSKAIDMVLEPGQFVLFNEKTLHRSAPNTSTMRRLGLAIRVTVPIVKVDHDQLFADHRCILLRGEDRLRLNRMADPPTA